MKKLLLLFIFGALAFTSNAQIQAQMWKGAGITHTKVPPTFTPAVTNSWVAIDSSTGYWWNWDKDCPCWREMGSSLQFTGTTGAPSYTPDQGLSRFALNSGDSLYAYQLGSWRHLNDLPNLAGYLQWSDTFNIATQYFVLSQGFLLAEVDGDPTNELQLLSISNDTIYLTSGGFVVLPPAVDTSGYNSSLTFANDTLWLTDDNSTLFAPIPLQEGLDSLRADFIDSLAAIDLTPYVQYSDSLTVFVTPSQLGDSLENYVQYGDSLTVFVTPDQLSDSLAALPDSIVSGYGVAGYLPQYLSATTQDTTGLYWDATTGRLGIGLSNPAAKLDVKGNGTTFSTYTFLLQNSAGVKIQAVLDNGYYYFGGTPNVSPLVFPVSTDKGTVDLAGRNLAFYSYNATSHTNSGAGAFNFHGASFSGTTGEQSVINLTKGFNPSSGTTVYKGINIVPTYNQTSTASGAVTGIDYNPTATSILGAHYGLLIRSGRSGFGQATPTARTHITGEGTNSSTTALLVENSAGTDALKVNDAASVGIKSPTNPTAILSIGSDGTYNGSLFVGAVGADATRIVNFGDVFEIVTNGSTGWTGQGFSIAGANRAFEFIASRSNVTDNFLFNIKVGSTATAFGTPTSGAKSFIDIGTNLNFAPTSGNASYTIANFKSTINQSSTASGTITGIDYNPTLTSVLGQHYGLLIRSGRSGFGTATPDASAIVDMTSTTQGLLPPRMTTAQRNAISSPATGLQVYNTTDSVMQHYTGIGWTSEENIVQDLTGYVEWADTLTLISTRQDLIDTAAAIRSDFPVGTTDLTIGGTGPTYTIESSTGADVTISAAGIATLSEPSANELRITATEVDGSITNEIQSISVTGTTTAVIDLSDDASDASITGAGISVVSVAGNAITVTSTEVDGSTTNELQDLSIGGSGPTYTVDISSGADVTISGGSGITLSEGTPNVLSVATTLTLDAGTYVPTLTNTTNISSSTAHGFQYMRVGSTVTVSGQVTVAATAANTTTVLELTIPVASALINDHELAGTGCGITTNNRVMAVQAQTTNDRAYVSWQPAATGDIIYSIHFTYQIL